MLIGLAVGVIGMAMDKKKQSEYITKWQKENRKRIVVQAHPLFYEIIKTNATESGKSVTQYIIDALEYYQDAKMLPNFPKEKDNVG